MFNLRLKCCKVIILCAGLLLFVVACGIPVNASVSPIHSLYIRVDKNQRQELFTQLQKFATQHAFEIKQSDLGTGGQDFQFEMLRQDIFIVTLDIHPDPTDVRIYFYPQPGVPVNQVTFDNLYNDLKGLLSASPGITITKAE